MVTFFRGFYTKYCTYLENQLTGLDITMIDKGLDISLQQAIDNKTEGINNYLKRNGKVYVTPNGPFFTLEEAAKNHNVPVVTVQRRLRSNKEEFVDWYIVSHDSKLSPEELCKQCDYIDNLLFNYDEKCWLCKVHHKHGEEVSDATTFTYTFKRQLYTTTLKTWKSNHKPHEA